MKHGILFSSSLDSRIRELREIVVQAIASKEDVGVYFIDDGVAALKAVQALRTENVKFYACAFAAQKRKIPIDPEQAVFGGLGILMTLISSSEKFTALSAREIRTSEVQKRGERIPVLIQILGDPSKSHVPMEALRVAVGLAASHQFDVSIQPSAESEVLFKNDSSAEIVDGEMLDQYLEILTQERILVGSVKVKTSSVILPL
jgi:hypothetical protein